ncbi:MAG: hypothetical protein AB7K09_21435 [Planctomycetota bacterium]
MPSALNPPPPPPAERTGTVDDDVVALLTHYRMCDPGWISEARRLREATGESMLRTLVSRGVITHDQAMWISDRVRSGQTPGLAEPRTPMRQPERPTPRPALPAPMPLRRAPRSSRSASDAVPDEWRGVVSGLTAIIVAVRLGMYSMIIATLMVAFMIAAISVAMAQGSTGGITSSFGSSFVGIGLLLLLAGLVFLGGYITLLVGVGMCMGAPHARTRSLVTTGFWLLIASIGIQIVGMVALRTVGLANGPPAATSSYNSSSSFAANSSNGTFNGSFNSNAANASGPGGGTSPNPFGANGSPEQLVVNGLVMLTGATGWCLVIAFFTSIARQFDSPKLRTVAMRLMGVTVLFYLVTYGMQVYVAVVDPQVTKGVAAYQAPMIVFLLAATLGVYWMGRCARLSREAIMVSTRSFAHAVIEQPRHRPMAQRPSGREPLAPRDADHTDEPSFI